MHLLGWSVAGFNFPSWVWLGGVLEFRWRPSCRRWCFHSRAWAEQLRTHASSAAVFDNSICHTLPHLRQCFERHCADPTLSATIARGNAWSGCFRTVCCAKVCSMFKINTKRQGVSRSSWVGSDMGLPMRKRALATNAGCLIQTHIGHPAVFYWLDGLDCKILPFFMNSKK